MVGVLTLFGEIDLQAVLKKVFMQNDLVFTADNCNTSVQLIDRACEHYKETDVVIIAASAMNMDSFAETVSEIRELESKMRIILILNGNSSQYLDTQLAEFDELRVDILYDDDGFDTQDLIELVKQGKLSRKRIKEIKRETAKTAPVKEFKKLNGYNPEKKAEMPEIDNEEADNAISEEKDEISTKRQDKKESFSMPSGKYTIGLFNVTHGAGATTAAINLATYFSLHGFITKLVDLSATDALSMTEIKNVEIGIGNKELDYFKRESNILIMDFGTPYYITPKGDNFMISHQYYPENIREINKCDIKIIMGFTDPWNICKIKFFLNNEQWREMLNNSYVFLVSGDEKKLKAEYPDINILNRDSDYMDEILQVIKEAE